MDQELGGRAPPRASSFRSEERKNSLKGQSIRFDDNHTFFEIECLNELEEQELLDIIWFTEQECTAMKADAYSVVSAIDAGYTDVDGRGLEGFTEQGQWEAYKARKDGWDIVIGEIEDCERAGTNPDYDKIARIYQEDASEPNMASALERAKADEEEARLHYEALEDELKAVLCSSIEKGKPSPQPLKKLMSFGEASTDSTTLETWCEGESESDSDDSDSDVASMAQDVSLAESELEDSDSVEESDLKDYVVDLESSKRFEEETLKHSSHLANPRRSLVMATQ